jgi:hypothetical protein
MLVLFGLVSVACAGGAVYGLRSLRGLERLLQEQAEAQRLQWRQDQAERRRHQGEVFGPLPFPECVPGPEQGNASMPGGC